MTKLNHNRPRRPKFMASDIPFEWERESKTNTTRPKPQPPAPKRFKKRSNIKKSIAALNQDLAERRKVADWRADILAKNAAVAAKMSSPDKSE